MATTSSKTATSKGTVNVGAIGGYGSLSPSQQAAVSSAFTNAGYSTTGGSSSGVPASPAPTSLDSQYANALQAAAKNNPAGLSAALQGLSPDNLSYVTGQTGLSPTSLASAPLSTVTPAAQQAFNIGDYYKNLATTGDVLTPAQKEAAYSDARKNIQTSLDAINNAKEAELRSLRQKAQETMGGVTATQARRGILGSSFATAQDTEARQAAQQDEEATQAKFIAQQAELERQANKDAEDRLNQRRQAMSQGVQAYNQFIQTDKANKVSQLGAALATAGLKGTDLASIDISTLAKQYGISESEAAPALIKAYADIAEQRKQGAFTVGKNEVRYEWNPKTGQYTPVGRGAVVSDTTSSSSSIPTTASGKPDNLAHAAELALNAATSKYAMDQFKSSYKNADTSSKKLDFISQKAFQNMNAAEKSDYTTGANSIKAIENALGALDKMQKQGAGTGRLVQGKEYVLNLTGNQTSPELSNLKQQMTLALQKYRNTVTGAAWGDQEADEYNDIFGNIGYTPEVLKQRLSGMKDSMINANAGALLTHISPTYSGTNIFNPSSQQPGNIVTASDGKTYVIVD